MKGITPRLAKTLMGAHFFGADDWTLFYKVGISHEQLHKTEEFPWGEEVLTGKCPLCGKQVRECHFAFLGINQSSGPLNLLKFQELHPISSSPRFMSYAPLSWYSKEDFAKTKMSLQWRLLHIEVIPGSEGKSLSEQKNILPPEYKIPRGIDEAAKQLLFFKINRYYPNRMRYARCADLTSEGNYVYVGLRPSYGLRIDRCSGSKCDNSIGVAASRKIPH